MDVCHPCRLSVESLALGVDPLSGYLMASLGVG